MTDTNLPGWVPIQQAADYLGVDPKTIRRYIAAGRLTARRVGPKLIRVERDSIVKIMQPMGGAA